MNKNNSVILLALTAILLSTVLSTTSIAQTDGETFSRQAQERERLERDQLDYDTQAQARAWQSRNVRRSLDRLTPAQKERLTEISAIYVDLMRSMPQDTKLLNFAFPFAYASNDKPRPKYDMDSDIAGGVALQINVKKPYKSIDKVSARTSTIEKINAGDLLCMTFWGRAIADGDQDSSDAVIGSLGIKKTVSKKKQPAEILFSEQNVALPNRWAQYAYTLKAEQDYEAGEAEIFYHFGNQRQKLELGPTYLFNLGQVDLDRAKGRACSV